MSERPVYLDHHATTPTDPRVVEAMLPYFTTRFGNPASVGHRYGWEAEEAVAAARHEVATFLGCTDREVIFTSGATESNNLAIKGLVPGLKARGDHLVTTAIEHRSVLDVMKRMGRDGYRVTYVAPDATGRIDPETVAAALTDQTILVSVIAASNEVGTINPLSAIGPVCRERGVPLHTDATQAVGKVPLDVSDGSVQALSFSGHKIHGPKGIGALYLAREDPPLRLTPLFDGGGHERGARSGTLAVPLIVGLGVACALARQERDEESRRTATLRDRLQRGLLSRLDGVRVNGHPADRLPNNLSATFDRVDGEGLMRSIREIAVSSGAACTSARPEPSHVLRAIGLDEASARATLRFGLGRFTTEADIDRSVEHVAVVVTRLRALDPRD
ncbi:MAG: cysteine desulfurase family protein [Isosphaeraceae bacterium]